jgi:serpin B
MLTEFSRLPQADLVLHLPRFKLAPPLWKLGHTLRKLGMNSAFDEPPRSANFERIAPRKPDEYLYLSEVLHMTFLDLDERGTEAAAATAVMRPPASAAAPRPKPVEVKVDRPFFFAIQHSSSGACLFIGRAFVARLEPKQCNMDDGAFVEERGSGGASVMQPNRLAVTD